MRHKKHDVTRMKICMVAAENGAIPGAKAGGLGDVIRDVPAALTELGHEVDIIMPGYGRFAEDTGAEPMPPLEPLFRGQRLEVKLSRLQIGGVTCHLLDHPLLTPARPGQIYHDDSPDRPFAADASRFALFCAGACELLRESPADVIHLHDWHAALVAVLARFDPAYQSLAEARLVFTIHNLAMQGIRPFAHDESSLAAWFPDLAFDLDAVIDPRYGDCFNPLRAAINLCDRVHTVSPTYAGEIRRPSRPEQGFYGGEGLEADLRRAHRQRRLRGILNGCAYRKDAPGRTTPEQFIDEAGAQLFRWLRSASQVDHSHLTALERLMEWQRKPPRHWLSAISRLTPQKVALLQQPLQQTLQKPRPGGASCLEKLLADLPPDHALVLLGGGDGEIEDFLAQVAADNSNFLFLKGYSEALSEVIYGLGELFLMPSSFEPCGIAQMLAMRAGQPCLAHRVGGLKDTINDGIDGFTFSGRDPARQAAAFLRKLRQALKLKQDDPRQWRAIRGAAAARKFHWADSARQYVESLYG